MKNIFRFMPLIGLLAVTGCASDLDIFPAVETSADETVADLPNPISIVVDAANSQLIVASSNVDIFYDTGSLATFSIDATDEDAPQLTATSIQEAPNFAGRMYYDGISQLLIPYRETSSTDSERDRLISYTVGAATLTAAIETTVSADPYGIGGDGSQFYVVSDDVLAIYGTDLSLIDEISLTDAEDAEFEDADSSFADSVAINSDSTRAIVSNRSGVLFVVDLENAQLVQTITGPTSTRDMIFADPYLYILDGATRQVWILDMNDFSEPAAIPEEVDDSSLMVATIPVGTDPNGMALDAVNDRLYVANTGSNSISVIDLITLMEITRISLDSTDVTDFERAAEQPAGLALGTFGGTQYLFVAGFGSNSVAMIHTGTLRLVEVFPNTDGMDDDDDEEDE